MKIIDWIKIILDVIVIMLLVVNIQETREIPRRGEHIVLDTTINRVTIDSINFKITKFDSVINKIQVNERIEIEKAINSSDSATVELFKSLLSE